MRDPVFSVVITTYNRARLLPRAIESVLGQTFRDFELLVIDNGSTDQTPAVVGGIKDGRLKYIRNPAPTASCDAPRNLGIRTAKGAYISFLDDDDLWFPEKLEKVKKVFDGHPEAEAVCHYEVKEVNGKTLGLMRHGPWTEDFYERLLYERNLLSPSAMTVAADTLRRFGGFDESEKLSEVADYDLWIRMAGRGVRVFFLEEPLGIFCLTGSNWSTTSPRFHSKAASMLKGHILAYENKGLFRVSKEGLWRLFRLYGSAGRSLLKSGRPMEALPFFIMDILFLAARPALAGRMYKMIEGRER